MMTEPGDPIIARMVRIRPARAADGPAIARIRARSWRAAYADVVPPETLAEKTSPAAIAREGEWRSAHSMDGFLLADISAAGDAGAGDDEAGDDEARPIGFAAYGPERSEDEDPDQSPEDPPDHGHAELYAIYVLPERWSAGTGRALMNGVLALAASVGYNDISLWVLEANARARRFYERAGFQATGESVVLGRLGGVTEIRYRRLVG